jgi:RNA polymerase sigma-70 factor (ECF subfamily)
MGFEHTAVVQVEIVFEQVVAEHGALVRRIARSYEANRALVDELVQDIYIALWEALPRFRGDAQLRTFVVKVAHNRAISHVAKEVRRPRSVELDDALPDPATRPDQAAERAEARTQLERAVARLPLGQRLVVTLALEGFSPEEIANVLGLNVSAASVRLHRAKAQLQELLREIRG